MLHRVKGFGVVNKAEVDVFLELSCFYCDPTDIGNLISGSSAFSKSNLNIWRFSVHILLKPRLEDLERDLASMRNECSHAVAWAFSGTVLLWYWSENWPSQSLFSAPLADAQAGKSVVGPKTSALVQELLWQNCSPVCGSPAWRR